MALSYGAVVVGAGPAGLSAAAELSTQTRCLLVEQGLPAPARDRDGASDVLQGAGGAGLFSDGKHSFFPSASELWKLPDREALAGAYDATTALLSRYGVEAGPMPQGREEPPAKGAWVEKHYPALYVGFDERLACIEELWKLAYEAKASTRVVDAERAGKEIALILEQNGRREEIRTSRLVVAGGRWSPRWMRSWLEKLGVSFAFQRVEFGVRLETKATNELFASLPGVDGKIRFVEQPEAERRRWGSGGEAPGNNARAVEIRTFCTCRNGEVVLGRSGHMAAYSGRADGAATGRSNVGLVVRIADPAFGRDVERTLYDAPPESFPLDEWLDRGAKRLAPSFGEEGALALERALERLLERSPGLRRGPVTVYSPCIEGVGDYPVDDGHLAVADGVWVAGDAIGRFRGIVASMISGRYAARRLLSP